MCSLPYKKYIFFNNTCFSHAFLIALINKKTCVSQLFKEHITFGDWLTLFEGNLYPNFHTSIQIDPKG